jgi:hypothetical protein
MNIKMLSDEELLRVVSPDSDLEADLFRRLDDALREIAWLQDEVQPCGPDAIDFDHECDCRVQEERINYLEEILDEHKIEYNK